jgi:hypothetical protein
VDAEIDAHVSTGDLCDKAGALVAAVEGCCANVVGLPPCETASLLAGSDALSPPHEQCAGFSPVSRGPTVIDSVTASFVMARKGTPFGMEPLGAGMIECRFTPTHGRSTRGLKSPLYPAPNRTVRSREQ